MIRINHGIIRLFLNVIIAFCFAASLTQARAEEKATTVQHTILVVGDSISAGFGIDKNSGWVALLQAKLGGNFHIVNTSISGETTSGGRTRLSKTLKQHQPDLVILELGGNDGLRGTPTKFIANNLSAMVKQIKGANSDVMLLGMRIPPNYGERYTQQFFSVFNTIASDHNTLFVPFLLEGVAGKPNMMQADGIHPTKLAQPIMMELVWAELQEWLKTLTNRA